MRCPKCQFVAFREIEKCPSCGEVLNPPSRGRGRPVAGTAFDDGPLGSYSTVEDVVGPLADYTLRAPESYVPASSRRRARRDAAGRATEQRAAGEVSGDSRARLSGGRETSSRTRAGSSVDGFAPERSPVRQLQRRLVAGLIDLGLLCGIDVAVVYFTTRLVGLPVAAAAELPLAPLVAFLVVFNVGYAVTLTAIGGQTIGKMAVGLRVEDADGSRVTPLHALIRTAAYLVSVLPLGLGFAGMFFRSRRALHDLLADTRVVQVS